MAVPTIVTPDDAETLCGVDELDILKTAVLPPTPPSSHSSRSTSPSPTLDTTGAGEQTASSKKKKKKKAKKPTKAKDTIPQTKGAEDVEERPVLCISRNKHWRYISSYHVRLDCGRT